MEGIESQRARPHQTLLRRAHQIDLGAVHTLHIVSSFHTRRNLLQPDEPDLVPSIALGYRDSERTYGDRVWASTKILLRDVPRRKTDDLRMAVQCTTAYCTLYSTYSSTPSSTVRYGSSEGPGTSWGVCGSRSRPVHLHRLRASPTPTVMSFIALPVGRSETRAQQLQLPRWG